MNLVEQYLTGKLQERVQAGNLRILSNQKLRVDFFSNDYLGLVTNSVLAGMIADLEKEQQGLCTTGSTGSRLLSGNSEEVMILEQYIAQFHKAEAALLFNSGYNANVGLLASIVARDTTILYDELCHASIIDGIRLSLTPKRNKFKHNNLIDLEEKILQHQQPNQALIVIVESIYSMDGDAAPLASLVQLCQKYNAQLIVDEAHATGVFGINGEGLVVELGLQNAVLARVHTFGKALGCHGAVVVGSQLLKDFLINFSRPFIYTTALSGHAVVSAKCAYQYLASPTFSNADLHKIISYFCHKIKNSGSEAWLPSNSPIQAYMVGNNQNCKAIATRLQAHGLQVKAILHPTVPLGKERLRICLHAYNTVEEVDMLFELLGGQ